MDVYHVQFEDGSEMRATARQLAQMCRHLPSWLEILRLKIGKAGHHAMIAIKTIDHNRHCWEEQRAAVFLDKPPQNWKFPETA